MQNQKQTTEKLCVHVLAHPPRDMILVRDLRQLLFHNGPKFSKFVSESIDVEVVSDVNDLLRLVDADSSPNHFLIVSGYPKREILPFIPPKLFPWTLVESHKPRLKPITSLLEPGPYFIEQCTPEILLKLMGKRSVMQFISIRPLKSEADFQQYFELRYKTWKALGYLSSEKDCAASKLEVDYSDKYSLALGAFSRNDPDQLVGSIRLIMETIVRSDQWETIQKVVLDAKDHNLKKAMERPTYLFLPFDVLTSFEAFPPLYREWVEKRLMKAEVSRVIVDQQWQGRGIGVCLIDSAISMAYQEGLDLLFLACQEEHESFYASCGFKFIPNMTCESFAGVEAPAIGMSLRLSKK